MELKPFKTIIAIAETSPVSDIAAMGEPSEGLTDKLTDAESCGDLGAPTPSPANTEYFHLGGNYYFKNGDFMNDEVKRCEIPSLLPCPFCGKAPFSDALNGEYDVHSHQVGCCHWVIYTNSEEEAVAIANERGTKPVMNGQVQKERDYLFDLAVRQDAHRMCDHGVKLIFVEQLVRSKDHINNLLRMACHGD